MPIFEDDCYADLIWDGKRPPALHAMSKHGGVIHIGSFSKSIAPALRVGYIVAEWALSRACWRSRPTPAPARWSRWCWANSARRISTTHVPPLTRGLRKKLETLMDALNEQFGTAAEFDDPKGGIFLWVKLPDEVDTLKLYQPALAAGVAINPGPGMDDRQGATAKAACGCASPIRPTKLSAPASPRSPKSAAANSACRTGSPMWSNARGRDFQNQNPFTTCVTCSTSGGEAKQWRDELAPFLKVGRAAKIDGVVLDRLPFDEQPVTRRLLDRALQFHAAAALGALEDRRGAFHAGSRIRLPCRA